MPIYHGTAHPRVSGENGTSDPTAWHKEGSSPRERGKLCPCLARGFLCGLIPA